MVADDVPDLPATDTSVLTPEQTARREAASVACRLLRQQRGFMANTLPSAGEVTYLADWILHGPDTDDSGGPDAQAGYSSADVNAAIMDAETPVEAITEALTIAANDDRTALRIHVSHVLLSWLYSNHRLIGPRPGEEITDAGRVGVLRVCKTCAGEGVVLDTGECTYSIVTVPDSIPDAASGEDAD
jgi:hypothetical protein